MNRLQLEKTLKFHENLAKKVAETSELQKLACFVITESISFMEASSGSIMVFDQLTNSLKLYISKHHPKAKNIKITKSVTRVPVNKGIAGQVFSTGQPIMVSNVAKTSGNRKLLRSDNYGSFLSVPLKLNKRVVGVINFNRLAEQPSFNNSDLEKFKTVNPLIASMIEKENLLETIEERHKEISSLYAISSVLTEVDDFTGRLEKFLKQLAEKLSLERLAIIAINKPTITMVHSNIDFSVLAAHNLKPSLLSKMFSSAHVQLQDRIIQQVKSPEQHKEDEIPHTLSFREGNENSELFYIPLSVDGKFSHILLVSCKYANDELIQAKDHYRFLYLISKNLGLALERETMLSKIQEDRKTLLENATRNRVFLEISKSLTSTLDPYMILQRAFNQFGNIISFSTISVLLFDDLDNNYRLMVQSEGIISTRYKNKLTKTIFDLFKDFPADPTISAENFKKNIFFKPHTTSKSTANDFKYTLHLPIVIGDKVRGLIHLARKGGIEFTKQELDITSQFTGIFITSIKNAMIHKLTEKLAFTDQLTELFNHRYFQETLKNEFIRADRYSKPLSLMIIDIDFFKKFNDNYGHLLGDKVLRHVATIFKSSVREQIDTVARYGGEEFAVILPETSIQGAYLFAERIRKSIEETHVMEEGKKLTVTLSIGVSCTETTECQKMNELIEAADIALYQAKGNGRNQVKAYEEKILKKKSEKK